MLGMLSMPNSLHMPFYFKTRGVKENPIPYVVYIVLIYVSISCRVVYPNVNRFFNGSTSAMALPLYYLEVILDGGVTCLIISKSLLPLCFLAWLFVPSRPLPTLSMLTCYETGVFMALTSLIISDVIVAAFIPLMNYSFSCLLCCW